MTRARRSLLLAGLALVLGGLAASDIAAREAALDRRLGPLVPVVVARTALEAGEPLRADQLAVRRVPARFAPRGAYPAPAALAGQRLAAPVPAGADVTAAVLEDPAQRTLGPPVRRGERVAEIVATGSPEHIVAGARVDVLVTRDDAGGRTGETELALEDVEVLSAAPAPTAGDGPGAGRVAASLRVTLRQAVFLAAAQSFARELRLLPRPAGDRSRAGPLRDSG
jgi:pilus assembly protein CpaB